MSDFLALDITEPYNLALHEIFPYPQDPNRFFSANRIGAAAINRWLFSGDVTQPSTTLFQLYGDTEEEIQNGKSLLAYLITNKSPISTEERWLLGDKSIQPLTPSERFQLFSSLVDVIAEAPVRKYGNSDRSVFQTAGQSTFGRPASNRPNPFAVAGLQEILTLMTHVLNHYSIYGDNEFGEHYISKAQGVLECITESMFDYDTNQDHLFKADRDVERAQMYQELRTHCFEELDDVYVANKNRPFAAMAYRLAERANFKILKPTHEVGEIEIMLLPWAVAYEAWTTGLDPTNEATRSIAGENVLARLENCSPPSCLRAQETKDWKTAHLGMFEIIEEIGYIALPLIEKYDLHAVELRGASANHLLERLLSGKLSEGPPR